MLGLHWATLGHVVGTCREMPAVHVNSRISVAGIIGKCDHAWAKAGVVWRQVRRRPPWRSDTSCRITRSIVCDTDQSGSVIMRDMEKLIDIIPSGGERQYDVYSERTHTFRSEDLEFRFKVVLRSACTHHTCTRTYNSLIPLCIVVTAPLLHFF